MKGLECSVLLPSKPPFAPILFVAEIFVNIISPDLSKVDERNEHSLVCIFLTFRDFIPCGT